MEQSPVTHVFVVICSPSSSIHSSLAHCSPKSTQGTKKEPPGGGASPSMGSLSLILLFAQLATTGHHCLNMLQLGQSDTKVVELGTHECENELVW